MKTFPALIALGSLPLAACSSQAPTVSASPVAAESTELPADAPSASAQETAPAMPGASARTLTLEGLDTLVVGMPVPASSDWKIRGAQASDECLIYTSPRFPGVYAIAEDNAVRRISVGRKSDVRLVEGIGAGTPEAEVKAAFAGFRQEPHKYEDAPAKYLTAPNAGGPDSALRFEIGSDGKVSFMHVGISPVLEYVEGCA